MPKEQKKRGRRAEEARKKQQEEEEAQKPIETFAHNIEDGEGFYMDEQGGYEGMPFFGLLDEQEQEYFRGADEMLKTDAFGTEEDRHIFIANVYKEAEGKELKLANSQGCSRLLERMISYSTPSQLKSLFKKCSGNFVHLVQHRFASHFCESLFAQSALVVAEELDPLATVSEEMEIDSEEPIATMESLFLFTLNEILPSIHIFLTHPFASHTIRVLLIILSGHSIEASTTNIVQSKKKEGSSESNLKLASERNVPDSFKNAYTEILSGLREKLSQEELRSLAIHKVGNPTLQLLLRLELTGAKKGKDGKSKSLLWKMIGETEGASTDTGKTSTASATTSSFIHNLFYDSVGSHLLETVVQCANDKTFKKLFDLHFKERLGSLARNETASFVVHRIVGRLDGPQLKVAMEQITPLIPNLLERHQITVIKALIDGCVEYGVDASKIIEVIREAYKSEDESKILFKLLSMTKSELLAPPSEENSNTINSSKKQKSALQRHGSLLAQSILNLPEPHSEFLYSSILSQPTPVLLALAQHPQASHVIQASVISPHSTTPYKRKLFNALKGHFAELSMSGNGSHIVDACWEATLTMNLNRKAIAEELVAKEAEIRPSFFGSRVWRNWKMDKFKTRRGEWMGMGKAAVVAKAESNGVEVKKTPIQLARERKAAERARAEETNSGGKTGSNNVAMGERGTGGNGGGGEHHKHPHRNSKSGSDRRKCPSEPLDAVQQALSYHDKLLSNLERKRPSVDWKIATRDTGNGGKGTKRQRT